jgi:crotonobetaine/carnitine-CoA ligase
VPALLLGARAAIGRRFSASGFWPEAHSVGATVFDFMGPTLSILSKREDSDAARENSVRLAWGGPMPPNAERSALEERWGLKLVHLYGSTDAGAVCWESLDGAEPEGSCGRPKFPYEVRIVDRFDDEVPRGTVGELTIRPQEPDLTMQGYWGMPNETLATFRNLWLHTGDLGRVDDRGHLFYAGRLKDSIRRRGENISAWEIEQVLSTHPAILECAAFGVPSELSEEEVMAAIVVREGGTLRAEDAREFCRGKMAKYMVPEHIEFVESIPKTPTGKPQKVELARMLGLARARRARPGSRA